MNLGRKLALVFALALAAMAVAAAPALAVTVTPTGATSGTSNNAELTGPIDLTCQSTTAGTIDADDGSGGLESLTFTSCSPNGCTVDSVTYNGSALSDANAMPFTTAAAPGDTTNTADDDATITFSAGGLVANVTCILTCNYTPAGNITVDATEGAQTIEAVNESLNGSGGFCGGVGSSTWTATYGVSPTLTIDPN